MYVSPQNSGQPGCFVCQMVGSHVHLFLADWRREQLQNGESVVVQQRPCSLWGSLRGRRVQGSCTKGRPSGPSLLTFPRNVMTTFLCTNSGSGRSQIWWQVPFSHHCIFGMLHLFLYHVSLMLSDQLSQHQPTHINLCVNAHLHV